MANLAILLAHSSSAATVTITAATLGNPTQSDLQSGVTVNNFGGFTGLTLTVTATGNHDTSTSPNIDGSSFRNSMPTVNATSEPGYTFEFNGNGVMEVLGLTLSSANNIFSRNISGTGFQARERVRAALTGGAWDSITPNPSGNIGQLQISGVGTSDASLSINLPTQAQVQFNTSGYTATATASSGSPITQLNYTYDFPLVTNGGQAPATLESNQPFSIVLDVEPVPEPSGAALMTVTALFSCLRRKRR